MDMIDKMTQISQESLGSISGNLLIYIRFHQDSTLRYPIPPQPHKSLRTNQAPVQPPDKPGTRSLPLPHQGQEREWIKKSENTLTESIN